MLKFYGRMFSLACSASLLLTACDSPPSVTAPKQNPAQHADNAPAASAQNNQATEKWVGQVGDRKFSESDISREFTQMPENFQKMKDNLQMRGNILNNVMTRYALTLEAKKEGIDQDPDIRMQLDRMEQNVLLQELNQRVKDRMKPDDAAVQAYYDANKAMFAIKAQVHVAHILVKDKALADSLLKKLKKGEDFSALAQQYSIDTNTKTQGGELAPFTTGMMVPEFEQAAFALTNAGDISGVVATNYGFHIIRLIEHIPAHQQSLAEIKEQIVNQLAQQNFRDWVEQVKKDMKVKVLEAAYNPPPTPKGT